MDNCNYNLNSSFTRFGANDTTNCQLKIDKVTFNRNKDTLTQKQIYANIANRTVRNLSVCIPDLSLSDTVSITSSSSGDSPPDTPRDILTPPPSPTPPDNTVFSDYSSKATQLVSEFHPDQIPDIVVENRYPSCSYKPIKF